MQVQKIANLVAAMRTQVSAFKKEARASGVANGKLSISENYQKKVETDNASLIAEKVHALSNDDPQKRKKAFRIFLELAIAAELGVAIMNDPRFLEMINDIQIQMYTDEELKPLIEECIDQLLSEK